MIFAEGSWAWAWSPKAYMFDSCLAGFSISSSVVPPEKLGEIGRIQERSRWRLGAEKARTAALTAAGFAMSDSGARPIKDEEGELVPIPVDIGKDFEDERWIKVKGFPEVPMSVLDFSKWKTVYSGRYVDNILLLEARALERPRAEQE